MLVGWQVRPAGLGRRRISGSKVGTLFAYDTVTQQCPLKPRIRRVLYSRTRQAAHWSQARAPIRTHFSCHAGMHGKREAAQVIGMVMGSLGRVRVAKFDARPSCALTFLRVRSVMYGSSGPQMLSPTETAGKPNAAKHGEDAWIGLQLSGDVPAARRPCRSSAAPARRVITAIARPSRGCYALISRTQFTILHLRPA